MAPGDSERPDKPDYNVYRAGSGGRGRGSRADRSSSKEGGAPEPKRPSGEEGVGYSVYRSRRRFGGSGSGGLGSLRDRFSRGGGGSGDHDDGRRFTIRRVLRWFAIAVGAWLLLSLVLFCVSAQIQKSKLDDAAADQLGGFPLLAADAQNILVIGTDVRPEGVPDDNGNPTAERCVDAAARGETHPDDCTGVRADTLMVVRAGGGAFEKLSIPRDTLAAIPGNGSEKINAAYSFGGASLQIETVEDFLGIDVDHVVILDFEGFSDFIDSIGGVRVDLPQRVKSVISGGASNGGVTLKLERGENDLDGPQALALARTRENERVAGEDDTDRAQRQQLILAAIQDRLTSPTRLPYNLIHAPWIAWNAPKAMVSDMGAFTLPQLVIAAGIGGNSDTRILKPSGTTEGGSLTVDRRQCEKAVEELLGEEGPREPQCSPG